MNGTHGYQSTIWCSWQTGNSEAFYCDLAHRSHEVGEASSSHHLRRKPPQGHLPEARFGTMTYQYLNKLSGLHEIAGELSFAECKALCSPRLDFEDFCAQRPLSNLRIMGNLSAQPVTV
jgi:hypothetical protein